MEDMDCTDEVFIRTAGLVDIHSRQNKIMFIIPTKTRSTVSVGDAIFDIYSTNRYGEMQGDQGPPLYDMDDHLVQTINRCLSSPRNLRSQFEDHARAYFTTGFNWVEVDTLVTSIVPRFHQRVEGNRVGRQGQRLCTGAPSDILVAYGLDPLPGLTPQSFHDYGGDHSVLPMDMRTTTIGRARRNPVILMGTWSNMAEIAVGTRYGTYDVHNVENQTETIARVSSGAHDRLNRARFLRLACENMKRALGVTDTVAFPRNDPANMPY